MVLLHPTTLVTQDGVNPTLQREFVQMLEKNDYVELNLPYLIYQHNTREGF